MNFHQLGNIFFTSSIIIMLSGCSTDETSILNEEQTSRSIGRGWPVALHETDLPRSWFLYKNGPEPVLASGELPEGITPLEKDIYTSDDFYLDRELWTDPRYFRCLSPTALDVEASSQNTSDDASAAPWGYCEKGYPREGIISPYPFKNAQAHYEALLDETEKLGGPTIHTRSTLPEWDGQYLRNVWIQFGLRGTDQVIPADFHEPPQWTMGPLTQVTTTLSLLTPEYQQRFVQQLYHQAHDRAAQWSGMFCRPDGFMRQWSEQGQGPLEITLTTDRLQFLSGGSDNIIRHFNYNRQFNLDGVVPRLGPDVPSWYGESIAFWDKDTLITWTSNIQGWFTHGSYEHSNKLQTIEVFTPRNNAEGSYIGLEHETIFYDEDALVEPVRQIRFFSKNKELSEIEPYTYVHCNQTIFPIKGRGEPIAPGTVIEYKVEDLYSRPWATVWEEWFEQDMEQPEKKSLFGF